MPVPPCRHLCLECARDSDRAGSQKRLGAALTGPIGWMNQDRFDQWRDLMDAWEALEADRMALEEIPATRPQSAVDALESEMDRLRTRIGAFVQEAGRKRDGISGAVRMGVLSPQE